MDIRQQVTALAKVFAPDPSLDLPVQAARDAAREARAELERAKATLHHAAKAYQPGTDRSALDAVERGVTRAHDMLRTRLDATVKAVAHREAAYQRAALLAFERARPAIAELTDLITELSDALKPLQEFAEQRDISGIRASAHVPAVRAGAAALAAMARQ